MCALDSILLVDDDAATNFYHTLILEDLKVARKIDVAVNGRQAMSYLSSEGEYSGRPDHCPPPDVIFLDLNMPVMGGFEFLSQYERLHSKGKRPLIYVLTSSTLAVDEDRARSFQSVAGFLEKPLSEEVVRPILERVKKH